MIYLGLDPGKSGAIAAIDGDGEPIGHIKLTSTDHDVSTWLLDISEGVTFAALGRVHSMPKQGVASSFKFGRSYGFLTGLLTAAQIPFDLFTPQKWQAAMRCRTGGDKNVTKAAAQRLFPRIKIIHAIADAYLLAEHARRVSAARNPQGGLQWQS